eukprot:jgi/Astpho2/4849/Aster-05785
MAGRVFAEVIWVGCELELHSMTRVLPCMPSGVQELPTWSFDGSQTGQAPEHCSVVYLKPRSIHPDPFRSGQHILVLCDTFTPPQIEQDGAPGQAVPHSSNNRAPCEKVMEAAAGSDPQFSVEQQFTLLDPASNWPLGWPEGRAPDPSITSYCGAGTGHVAGRNLMEEHMAACLQAQISISGSNAGAVPGQWSYSLGPCPGIQLGDQLWLSRYLLMRCAERQGVIASLDPMPVPGNWSGCGAAIHYSTRETRQPGKGWYAIQQHVMRLGAVHMQHMMVYGQGNIKRLLSPDAGRQHLAFTWGLEQKSASVCIPHSVLLQQQGHLEDRRPASNMDPYLVTMMLVCTTLGYSLPFGMDSDQHSSCSESVSEALSRGSSAILEEMEQLDSISSNSQGTSPFEAGTLAECSEDYDPHQSNHTQVYSGMQA